MDTHTTLPSKARKSAPTGGNRSWSEEEVSFLRLIPLYMY